MTLFVDFLEVKDFRNYEWFMLELSHELTIVQGPNATGKTNLIEALQLLTSGESFRSPKWDDLIREGATRARASITASGDGREMTVVVDLEVGKGRSYRVNGKSARSVAAASGAIPCVLFTPEDLNIAKGSSATRRAPLDVLGSQVSPAYGSLRREYNRILRQRNSALKNGDFGEIADSLTEQIVVTGSRLTAHRERLLERLIPFAQENFRQITDGEQLDLHYEHSWKRENLSIATDPTEQALREALEATRQRERARGATVVGPHRDDVRVEIGGREARRFGSQGQQRAVALAWKLAEVDVIEQLGPQKPILLLDDVMSELDEKRRHALANRVRGHVQTVITTTNLHYFDEDFLKTGRVVSLG